MNPTFTPWQHGRQAGLVAVSMLKDLGLDVWARNKIGQAVLEVRIDASAGRGIAARTAARRIRHIPTPTLRVQKRVQDGEFKITKIPGASNPADRGTKLFDGRWVQKVLD